MVGLKRMLELIFWMCSQFEQSCIFEIYLLRNSSAQFIANTSSYPYTLVSISRSNNTFAARSDEAGTKSLAIKFVSFTESGIDFNPSDVCRLDAN